MVLGGCCGGASQPATSTPGSDLTWGEPAAQPRGRAAGQAAAAGAAGAAAPVGRARHQPLRAGARAGEAEPAGAGGADCACPPARARRRAAPEPPEVVRPRVSICGRVAASAASAGPCCLCGGVAACRGRMLHSLLEWSELPRRRVKSPDSLSPDTAVECVAFPCAGWRTRSPTRSARWAAGSRRRRCCASLSAQRSCRPGQLCCIMLHHVLCRVCVSSGVCVEMMSGRQFPARCAVADCASVVSQAHFIARCTVSGNHRHLCIMCLSSCCWCSVSQASI